MVSFWISLLLSQTCYKGHKHWVLKHPSNLWKTFSSLGFWDVVTALGFFIWTLCQIASADSGLMGWLYRKIAFIVDKTQLCTSALHYRIVQSCGQTGWVWALQQCGDTSGKLWDVEVISAVVKAETNSCNFPISAQLTSGAFILLSSKCQGASILTNT